MRLGQITWLAAVPLSLTLVGLLASQPGEAKSTRHHGHKKACAASCCSNSIVSEASKNGLSSFVAAVKSAGLTATLNGKGPFTVFAPDNHAFGDLGKNGPTGDKLAKVLKYHVVKGNFSSTDLSTRRSIPTLEGEDLMLNSKDGKLIADGGICTKPDIKCGNGVIHVIDTVLSPERGK